MTLATSVPWSQFAREVLTLYTPPIRRRATYEKTRLVLSEFGRLCPETGDIGPLAIAKWLADHSGRAPLTNEGLLRHFQAACSYGVSKGFMSPPFAFRPVSKWIPADERVAEREFPLARTAAEIAAVLHQADEDAADGEWSALRLRALVYCWAYTGADKTAILGLRTVDFDAGRGSIRIRSHANRRLKTAHRANELPLAEKPLQVLLDWKPRRGSEYLLPHKGLTGPWLHGRPGHMPLDQVRELGERAKVKGLKILSFRHSYATLAEAAGIGPMSLQRILGHAVLDTQWHYRHNDFDQLRKEMAKMRFE